MEHVLVRVILVGILFSTIPLLVSVIDGTEYAQVTSHIHIDSSIVRFEESRVRFGVLNMNILNGYDSIIHHREVRCWMGTEFSSIQLEGSQLPSTLFETTQPLTISNYVNQDSIHCELHSVQNDRNVIVIFNPEVL